MYNKNLFFYNTHENYKNVKLLAKKQIQENPAYLH